MDSLELAGHFTLFKKQFTELNARVNHLAIRQAPSTATGAPPDPTKTKESARIHGLEEQVKSLSSLVNQLGIGAQKSAAETSARIAALEKQVKILSGLLNGFNMVSYDTVAVAALRAFYTTHPEASDDMDRIENIIGRPQLS